MANKNIFVTETIQILHESEGPIGAEWDADRIKYLEKYVASEVIPDEVEGEVEPTVIN
jgi:hypothetical protein